jgi:hypothetical protein
MPGEKNYLQGERIYSETHVETSLDIAEKEIKGFRNEIS